jgi:hypothetical protein
MPYHYIITVKGTKGDHLEEMTVNGEWWVGAGDTRQEAFEEIQRQVMGARDYDSMTVSFYSLEPQTF